MYFPAKHQLQSWPTVIVFDGKAIPSNALLTESGEPILTEDGQFLLIE